LEIYHLGADEIRRIASQFGQVNTVGTRFGILKLQTQSNQYDLGLPRRENKIGAGHRGFLVETDKDMSPLEAARRRDYTMNSIYLDPLTDETFDPFDGLNDLRSGLLRITDPQTFKEDPTRVLRGMQFCGRFDLVPTSLTVDVCSSMIGEADEIAKEMVWVEWEKWASKSTVPSQGLQFLRDIGWIWLYPELQALVETPQDPTHHPEGNVWEHTLQVVDHLAGQGIVAVLAGLCHDLGKPACTVIDGDSITSQEHEQVGAIIAKRFLRRLNAPRPIIDTVVSLVKNHMLDERNAVTPRAVRRLAVRLGEANIGQLSNLILADRMGRVPYGQSATHCARCGRPLTDPESIARGIGPICLSKWQSRALLNKAKELQCAHNWPRAILMGRHLLEHNWMKPGPEMGKFLRFAYDLQIQGVFDDLDGALAVCRAVFKRDGSSHIKQLWSEYK
jgi:tRNA nucleotidyltransferase (CCA-adding enzyme)